MKRNHWSRIQRRQALGRNIVRQSIPLGPDLATVVFGAVIPEDSGILDRRESAFRELQEAGAVGRRALVPGYHGNKHQEVVILGLVPGLSVLVKKVLGEGRFGKPYTVSPEVVELIPEKKQPRRS